MTNSSGTRNAVRSTNQTPAGNARRSSRANRPARRVLPVPPTPVNVTP